MEEFNEHELNKLFQTIQQQKDTIETLTIKCDMFMEWAILYKKDSNFYLEKLNQSLETIDHLNKELSKAKDQLDALQEFVTGDEEETNE